MAGTKIRKTKKRRIGGGVDERVRSIMKEDEVQSTSSQWGFSSLLDSQGPDDGGIPELPTTEVVLKDKKTAAASGGTAVFDFQLVADMRSAHGLLDAWRASYAEGGPFHIITLSGTPSMFRDRTRLPTGADSEFTIAATITSSRIRLTITNNHATEDLTVAITYTQTEAD